MTLDILGFAERLAAEAHGVAVIPVTRLSIETSIDIAGVKFSFGGEIGGFDIFLNSIDERAFYPIETHNDELSVISLSGDTLRRTTTALTGFSKSLLDSEVVAVLAVDADWGEFESYSHNQDLALLDRIRDSAFAALDLVRYQFCTLDLPDTLPGIPGYWADSGDFSGCVVLSPLGSGRCIAGCRSGSSINHGLGLELTASQVSRIHESEDAHVVDSIDSGGEIGKVARKGMHMLSRAMYANNDTLKFISAMALIEYLGTGAKYDKFEVVRKAIQPHVAKSRSDYEQLGSRFRELTSFPTAERNKGLRHQIVHEGALLEELIVDRSARQDLFRELDRYIGKVIHDLCGMASFSWEALGEWRADQTKQLLAQ